MREYLTFPYFIGIVERYQDSFTIEQKGFVYYGAALPIYVKTDFIFL